MLKPGDIVEKKFPIQATESNYPRGERIKIPWKHAELAYREYSRRYGTGQSLERLAERGGFSVGEVVEFLASQIDPTTKTF